MSTYVPSYSVPFPVYQPAMRVIAGITTTYPVIITTTIKHQYKNGLVVRIDIPEGFGMEQLNQQFGEIIVTGDYTFTMDINTTNYTPFVLPITFPPAYQDAQSVPIAENNTLLNSSTNNVLPYGAS